MNTKNLTNYSVSTTAVLMASAGSLVTSVASAWVVSDFGPATCEALTFSAALERIPLVLNLAIFLATIVVTTAFCHRLGPPSAPPLSFTWLLCWWPIGAGCVGGVLLFSQLPAYVWSDFAACTRELGSSPVHLQTLAAASHVVGWFVTLLLLAWRMSISARVPATDT